VFIASFSLKTAIQKLLCAALEALDFPLIHPKRELQRRAMMDTVDYITENAINTPAFDTAKDVLLRALASVRVEGVFAEFGVYKGSTINFIAKQRPKQTIWGFDGFEGLAEEWSGNTSVFDAHGVLPKVRKNVRLVKGWFDASLPAWLTEHGESVAFVHVDCDIYSSTKVVLQALAPRLQPGAIIVFDEYFGYPGWRNHEFKAFQEFVHEHGVRYQYLYFSRIQCAVKILANATWIGGAQRGAPLA
jgi:hypothetical protein